MLWPGQARVDFVAIRGTGDVDKLLDPRVRTVLNGAPRPKWKWWLFDGWAELREWVAANRPTIVIADYDPSPPCSTESRPAGA